MFNLFPLLYDIYESEPLFVPSDGVRMEMSSMFSFCSHIKRVEYASLVMIIFEFNI